MIKLDHTIFDPMPLPMLHEMRAQFLRLQQRAEGMRPSVMRTVWRHRLILLLSVVMIVAQAKWAAEGTSNLAVFLNGAGAGIWAWCAYYSWLNWREAWKDYVETVDSLRADIARINEAIKAKGKEHEG